MAHIISTIPPCQLSKYLGVGPVSPLDCAAVQSRTPPSRIVKNPIVLRICGGGHNPAPSPYACCHQLSRRKAACISPAPHNKTHAPEGAHNGPRFTARVLSPRRRERLAP